jgi:hypothetical protein
VVKVSSNKITMAEETINADSFYEIRTIRKWHSSYDKWIRSTYAATLEGIEVAKEDLRIKAKEFFGEAAAVCDCAYNAVRDDAKIREERNGF